MKPEHRQALKSIVREIIFEVLAEEFTSDLISEIANKVASDIKGKVKVIPEGKGKLSEMFDEEPRLPKEDPVAQKAKQVIISKFINHPLKDVLLETAEHLDEDEDTSVKINYDRIDKRAMAALAGIEEDEEPKKPVVIQESRKVRADPSLDEIVEVKPEKIAQEPIGKGPSISDLLKDDRLMRDFDE